MNFRTQTTYLIAGGLLCACLLGAADEEAEYKLRRLTIGFRIQSQPARPFKTQSGTTTTTKPVAEYSYSATSKASHAAIGPTAEYRVWRNVSLVAEFRFRKVEFQQVTTMKSGTVDPNAGGDDRLTTTIKQSNKVDYWEFPLLVRYQGLYPSKWGKKAYVTAGMQLRHVGRIRTGTSYAYADSSTDYDETALTPSRANQYGFVVGAGMRVLEHFKGFHSITPEIRYVGWQGSTFEGQAYRSRSNQVEAGIGFSF